MSGNQPGSEPPRSVVLSTLPGGADPALEPTPCALCGGRLPAGDEGCVPCMLRAALGEPEEADADGAFAGIPGPAGSHPAADIAGKRFSHFEIVAGDDGAAWELGRGAMGVTYRAFDTVLRCPVALKVIHRKVAEHPAARERFLREARAAAQLRHPNVASVTHYGEQEGQCFYAMELVGGETLEARVRRDGPLPVALALEVATQVANALVAAERCGLVHRDLKPSNLMVATGESGGPDAAPSVKVIDFGLVKAAGQVDLTHGGFVGTPSFASPEQFGVREGAGEKLDARSDIYSLGVTLWFLLTAKVPFAGRTVEEIHDRQTRRPLPLGQLTREQVPASVVALLRSMLAADPAGRPGSARELSAALRRGRESLDTTAVSRRRWRAGGLLTLGLLIFLGAVVGLTGPLWRRQPVPAHRESAAAIPVAPAPEKSLAVLPFQPLMPDHRDQALELGMADTLIGKLSTRQTIVRSLSSVRQYDHAEQNPQAAGRELGVRSVLEGSVQRSADRIRVTARLINVADGAALWAGTFDEPFTDVFAVQDAISQKVVNALALRLSGDEQQRLSRRETDNVEAYQLYLLGRFHFGKLSPPEIRVGIGFFQRAIAVDARYALAYFGLAESYRALTITGDQRPLENMPPARAAAMKALELDESLAEPHATLAFVHFWFDWDWAAAEREAKRAIELNPNSAFAHAVYAHLLSNLGRHPEAINEGVRAIQLDPVSLMINMLGSSAFFHARRYEEASAMFQKTLELDPTFWIAHLFLGKILVQQGRYAEAEVELGKAREYSHGNSLTVSVGGYAAALAGDTVKARAVLGELQLRSARRYVPPQTIALIYYGLDQRDEAFAWLEKSFEEHDVHLSFIEADPQWDSLRADPRFAALRQRIGLH